MISWAARFQQLPSHMKMLRAKLRKLPLSETRSGRQVILEIQRALIAILSVIVVIVGSFFVFFYD